MIIGLDFDGVLCVEYKWPWFLWFFRELLRPFSPAISGFEVVRDLCKKHKIIVVTKRPKFFLWFSWLWLKVHRLPISVGAVFCTSNKDKTFVLLREKVCVYFDNDLEQIESAKAQGITAFLFQSWKEAIGILENLF